MEKIKFRSLDINKAKQLVLKLYKSGISLTMHENLQVVDCGGKVKLVIMKMVLEDLLYHTQNNELVQK